MMKKNKGLIITIIILVVLLLGAVGYIGYDKFLVNEDAKEVTKTEKEEELDINNDLVQELFGIFRLDYMDKLCYMSVDGLNNNKLVRLRLAYNNLSLDSTSNISCSEADASVLSSGETCGEITEEISKAMETGNTTKINEAAKNNITSSVSEDVLKRKMHELFGSNYNYENEDFGLNNSIEPKCNVMHYDKSKKIYAHYEGPCGGTCGGGIKQTIKKATKTEEKVKIITDMFNEAKNESTTVTYYFKYDKENYHYVFDKVEES